tara:strand:+ start:308 stop:592 length:285 start_codon:yes stop_codon:yes gene_type:complete
MKTKKQKQFGRDWTNGQLKFPKHLTPQVIHSALFVFNAPTKEEIKGRVEYCAKQIGDELMSYAMALLVLPTLMDNMQQSNEYKEWQQSRIKTLN